MTSEDQPVTDTSTAQEQVAPEQKPKHAQLTPEVLAALKRAGYPKPEGVSWGAWIGLKKLSARHHVIAMKAAAGVTAREISREMGITESRLSIILNCPRMLEEVAKIRDKYFGSSVAETFKRMAPKSAKLLEDVVDDERVKTGVRVKAATEVLNRAYGKPKETLEVQHGSIRELFELMNKITTGQKVLDLRPARPQPVNVTPQDGDQNDIEVTATEVLDELPSPKRSVIDRWIDKNIPHSSGIGAVEKKEQAK